MKTPSDRLQKINERINDLTLTALVLESRLTKAGEWDENKHPRADDGKFGSGSGSHKVPEKKEEKKESSGNKERFSLTVVKPKDYKDNRGHADFIEYNGKLWSQEANIEQDFGGDKEKALGWAKKRSRFTDAIIIERKMADDTIQHELYVRGDLSSTK
jgi:hypothetical protein